MRTAPVPVRAAAVRRPAGCRVRCNPAERVPAPPHGRAVPLRHRPCSGPPHHHRKDRPVLCLTHWPPLRLPFTGRPRTVLRPPSRRGHGVPLSNPQLLTQYWSLIGHQALLYAHPSHLSFLFFLMSNSDRDRRRDRQRQRVKE